MDFKISCLIFIRNSEDEILLLKRLKSPNQGFWSPPGGKLKMSEGESPYECAIREAKEETGMDIVDKDLSIFGYVSEKAYENSCHWLMFLFDCHKIISEKPKDFNEGTFSFFSRKKIDSLKIPSTDNQLVWPLYDKRKHTFWGINADCSNPASPKIKIEAGE